MVAHTCHPSAQKADTEAEGQCFKSAFPAQAKLFSITLLKPNQTTNVLPLSSHSNSTGQISQHRTVEAASFHEVEEG